MAASQSIAVEACIAVEAILVVALFIVDCRAVVRAAVETRPVLAADITESVAALAANPYQYIPPEKGSRNLRDVVARFGQLYSRAADKALLIALLGRCLTKLLLVFILFALMVLRALVEQGLALDARQRAAVFTLADSVRDLRRRVFDV
jgi:hypothetical protein